MPWRGWKCFVSKRSLMPPNSLLSLQRLTGICGRSRSAHTPRSRSAHTPRSAGRRVSALRMLVLHCTLCRRCWGNCMGSKNKVSSPSRQKNRQIAYGFGDAWAKNKRPRFSQSLWLFLFCGRIYTESVLSRYSTERFTLSSCVMAWSTTRIACITVPWSRPPKRLPIS